MPSIAFSPNIRIHVDIESLEIEGATIGEALDHLFQGQPRLRGYLLDDRGTAGKHIAIFLDGSTITDREHLTPTLSPQMPGSS